MIFQATNVLQQGPSVCVSWLPPSSHFELYAALVCGLNLPSGPEKQVFLDSGLIHLMVVSGAHLIFLEALLVRAPLWLRLLVLGGYCWLTGFGAPVVKAFLRRMIEGRLRERGWSGLHIEAAAVTLTLILWPSWLLSRSLQMSWMCALALSLPLWIRPKSLDQSMKAYALLFLFSGASLLSIAWNTLIAPFVGAVLFPLCLLVLPFPFLVGAVDRVWDLFLYLLRLGPLGEPQDWFLASRHLFWIPPLVHWFLIWWEVRWRRARAFSL